MAFETQRKRSQIDAQVVRRRVRRALSKAVEQVGDVRPLVPGSRRSGQQSEIADPQRCPKRVRWTRVHFVVQLLAKGMIGGQHGYRPYFAGDNSGVLSASSAAA